MASRSADCTSMHDIESQIGFAENKVEVERPQPFVTFSIYRARNSLLIKHITDIVWIYAAVKRLCSIGFMPDSLAESIFYLSLQIKLAI